MENQQPEQTGEKELKLDWKAFAIIALVLILIGSYIGFGVKNTEIEQKVAKISIIPEAVKSIETSLAKNKKYNKDIETIRGLMMKEDKNITVQQKILNKNNVQYLIPVSK